MTVGTNNCILWSGLAEQRPIITAASKPTADVSSTWVSYSLNIKRNLLSYIISIFEYMFVFYLPNAVNAYP